MKKPIAHIITLVLFTISTYGECVYASGNADTLVGMVCFNISKGQKGTMDSTFGSTKMVFWARNNGIEDDTLIISYNGTQQKQIIPAGVTLQYSLPTHIGMVYSHLWGCYDENNVNKAYSACNVDTSAFFIDKYINKMVWVRKNPNTQIFYQDSGRKTNNTFVSYVSYYNFGIDRHTFGNNFRLEMWKDHCFSIVAMADSTPVDIVFKRKHLDSNITRTYPKQRLYLNKGDIYEFANFTYDCSGTEISAPLGCKPIAIFQRSGVTGKEGYLNNNENSKVGIGCIDLSSYFCNNKNHYELSSYSNNYCFETPYENAGYVFYVPNKVKGAINLIEIKAIHNNTLVFIGDENRQRSLKKGETYFDTLTYACKITATQPVICKYFSQYAILSDNLIPYGGKTSPTYRYNRWVQQPTMDIENGSKVYDVFIPHNNPRKVVNMETILYKNDTLYVNNMAVAPFHTQFFDSFKSISFALDSGWHKINAPNNFLAWVSYFKYYADNSKNGTTDIFLDSSISPTNYNRAIASSVFSGNLLGYNPVRYVQSVRVNGKLKRELTADTPYFKACQYSAVSLWGRADFYTATANFWVLPNNDTIKNAQGSFNAKDTGFFTLKFVSGKKDTLCDGSYNWVYDESTVKIYVSSNPRIYLPKDTIVCKGTSLKITAVSDKDTALNWRNGNFMGASTGLSVVAKIDSAVQIIASVRYGNCPASEDTIVVAIYDTIFTTLPKDTLICHGSNYSLNPLVKGGDTQTYKYLWSDGDTQKTWNKNVFSPINLRLYVSDKCGIAYQSDSTQKISLLPKLSLDIGSDTFICKNSNLVIKAKASGGLKNYNYQWQDGSTVSILTLSNITKDTIVTCVLRDNCSANDTQKIQITILPDLKWLSLTHDSFACPIPSDKVNFTIIINSEKNIVNTYTITDAQNKQYIYYSNDSLKASLVSINGNYRIQVGSVCNPNALDTTVAIKELTPNLKLFTNDQDTFCLKNVKPLVFEFTTQNGGSSSTANLYDNGVHIKTKAANSIDSFDLSNLNYGPHTLKIAVDNGCVKTEKSIDIIILQTLILYPIQDKVLCASRLNEIELNYSTQIPTNTTWEIKDEQGSIVANSAKFYLQPLENTKYYVTGNDQCSPLVNDSFTIFVRKRPIESATFNPLEACRQLNTTATIPRLPATSYPPIWSIEVSGLGSSSFDSNIKSYVFNIAKPGAYIEKLSLIDENLKTCWDTSIFLNVYPQPTLSIIYSPLEPEITDASIVLNSQTTYATQWQWQINDTVVSTLSSHSFKPYYIGNYEIKLIGTTDKNCKDSAFAHLNVKDYYRSYIPNAFSPNGDGLNDIWQPIFISAESVELKIFNRWGEMMHSEKSLNPSWDGKLNGNIVPDGNYIYVIHVTFGKNKYKDLQGNFILIKQDK